MNTNSSYLYKCAREAYERGRHDLAKSLQHEAYIASHNERASYRPRFT